MGWMHDLWYAYTKSVGGIYNITIESTTTRAPWGLLDFRATKWLSIGIPSDVAWSGVCHLPHWGPLRCLILSCFFLYEITIQNIWEDITNIRSIVLTGHSNRGFCLVDWHSHLYNGAFQSNIPIRSNAWNGGWPTILRELQNVTTRTGTRAWCWVSTKECFESGNLLQTKRWSQQTVIWINKANEGTKVRANSEEQRHLV